MHDKSSDPHPSREELPLPDYDHLPVSGLEHRMRTLPADDLRTVRAYEQEHADRPRVKQMIDHRLDQLEHGSTPSGGDPAAHGAEQTEPTRGRSPVSPQTAALPPDPLPHGTYDRSRPTQPNNPRTRHR
ncbi:hypothetical protein KQH42_04800 [Streptomyces sp. CHA1]|uniref:hypothetical protein n=1 Tax=Streptomyces TaxID=1883 RepID=UPI001BFBF72D|nr:MULTISPECIES: hypothetical protein [unclassified Streptomyces]WSB23197.1 hypothetical protein OHB02_24825 [Streptomyces albidoflavus]MBT3159260.1 hypothetical protein [Streptomyces sp. G11C]MCO6700013.1 hypothetical protein [Streptomyces sp. CHB9.2]MCO6706161.1 hypothetical protein [Streptomyces sp. CHA3]MCO6711898.1 hypothetical protein [Streptomyces sp. CHB19.2]